MTPTRSLAAGAAVTGLLAAAMPGTAAGATTLPTDAITQCLVQAGYPALPTTPVVLPAPTSSVLLPVPAAPAAPTAAPAALAAPTAGTTTTTIPATGTPALPATGTPALPATGTTPGGTTGPAVDGSAGLQCGEIIINNTMYMVVVTVTTTTTNVSAPITAAAGSINTTSNVPGDAAAVPGIATAPGVAPTAGSAPSASALRGSSAIGKPLEAHGSARTARRQPASKSAAHRSTAKAKRLVSVRVRLVRRSATTRR